jgi:hypothetical protein
MSEPLAIYSHDHLAGAVVAINLLEVWRDQRTGESLGQFAAELLVEVEADRAVLQGFAERVGAGSSRLKEATAWLGEKVSRLKLRRRAAGGLGTFEALEALARGARLHGTPPRQHDRYTGCAGWEGVPIDDGRYGVDSAELCGRVGKMMR